MKVGIHLINPQAHIRFDIREANARVVIGIVIQRSTSEYGATHSVVALDIGRRNLDLFVAKKLGRKVIAVPVPEKNRFQVSRRFPEQANSTATTLAM